MRPIRNIRSSQKANDGTRPLEESILSDSVAEALKEWPARENCLLIGGLAVSFWVKPRFTQDVDVMFLSASDAPSSAPEGFRRTRAHAFEHKVSGVEIEVLDPGYVNVPSALVKYIFDQESAHRSGFRIPTPPALIALKCFRFSAQDVADIVALLEAAEFHTEQWKPFLSQAQLNKLAAIRAEFLPRPT